MTTQITRVNKRSFFGELRDGPSKFRGTNGKGSIYKIGPNTYAVVTIKPFSSGVVERVHGIYSKDSFVLIARVRYSGSRIENEYVLKA